MTLVGIPSGWTVTPQFTVTPPPAIDGAPPVDWSTVPIVFDTESSLGQIVPLFIAFIPAGATVDLHFTMNPNDNLGGAQLQAWVGLPFFQSPINPSAVNCLVSVLSFANSALGVIPDLSCGVALGRLLAGQFLTFVGISYQGYTGSLMPGKIIASMAQMLVGANVAGLTINCGVQGIPLLGPMWAAINTIYIGVNNTIPACGLQPVLTVLRQALLIDVIAPHDPNEKAGALGVGPQKYISGRGAVPYSILFENTPTATAPAQEVVVSDSLDPDLDLSTLSLGPITIGRRQIPIPATFSPAAGLKEITTTIDLRPAQNLGVIVHAKLDLSARLLTWTFISVDPETSLPPTDPTAGFLPPGTEGSIFFTVKPKQGLTTGTQITNQASVVFDQLAPISTLPWTNTIDATPPTSHVLPLPAVENSSSFQIQWSGTDLASGILDYTIFVSENGGPFTPFLTHTTDTSVTFSGQVGKSYAFYSIARDQTGNQEDAKTTPEATTQVSAGDTIPPTTTATPSPTPNPTVGTIPMQLSP